MAAAPHKTLGAAAFFASLGSAAIHAGYFYFTRVLPVYPHMGGINVAFSLKAWIATSTALTLGGLAVVFLITACLAHRQAVRSWVHLATLVFLIPAGFTTWWLLAILIQFA